MPRSPSTASRLRIAITTGDPDGIGWEVTAKALAALGPVPGTQFLVLRSSLGPLDPGYPPAFRTVTIASLDAAEDQAFDPGVIIDVASAAPAARWVEDAARACLGGRAHGMVTAPLSKTSIIAAGLRDIGHTEILGRLSGVRHLHMGFVGDKFAVVLATGHQSLLDAVRGFDEAALERAIAAARELRASLPGDRRTRPIAVVGVNPHAGEAGLLGTEESWFARVVGGHPDVRGPLVPDAAYLPKYWPTYAAYVAPYHDQGLIPFKLVHGFDGGVHLTLGLPFVRSSVDHGTAKDLFGKNLADPGSMKDAITTALRLAQEKFR